MLFLSFLFCILLIFLSQNIFFQTVPSPHRWPGCSGNPGSEQRSPAWVLTPSPQAFQRLSRARTSSSCLSKIALGPQNLGLGASVFQAQTRASKATNRASRLQKPGVSLRLPGSDTSLWSLRPSHSPRPSHALGGGCSSTPAFKSPFLTHHIVPKNTGKRDGVGGVELPRPAIRPSLLQQGHTRREPGQKCVSLSHKRLPWRRSGEAGPGPSAGQWGLKARP